MAFSLSQLKQNSRLIENFKIRRRKLKRKELEKARKNKPLMHL
jgi:hypothetical protein